MVGVAAIATLALAGCAQSTNDAGGSTLNSAPGGAASANDAGAPGGSSSSGTSGGAGAAQSAAGTSESGTSESGTGESGASESSGSGGACDRTQNNDFTLPHSKPSDLKDGFTVSLVRQSGVGDYFEQWGNGATAQIKAAGGKVTTYDARGDNGKQVTQFDQAINSKPDVIIVDHGLADSVNPKIDQAISAGIPVVVYDVDIANCKAMYISQNDESIASSILGYMKKDSPDGGKLAYVNVSGIAPLDTRNGVYQKFMKANPTYQQVAHFGKYTESVSSDTASEGAAALKAAPKTSLVFCAYDELCKGTLIALKQDGMTDQVKVYGVDVSTADIQLMTEKGSPWRATAATDPANVGAIVARAAIAAAGGVTMPEKMTVPAALITQNMLRKKDVKNMNDLRAALPDLRTPDFLGASWIPEIKPGQ
jgi:simple sugar transport system substrate-binding protein